jgi:hypothetical protein
LSVLLLLNSLELLSVLSSFFRSLREEFTILADTSSISVLTVVVSETTNLIKSLLSLSFSKDLISGTYHRRH